MFSAYPVDDFKKYRHCRQDSEKRKESVIKNACYVRILRQDCDNRFPDDYHYRPGIP